jgi:adenylate cyclase
MRELVRTRAAGRPLSATLEREIAQILVQSAPHRQQDGPLQRVISVLCVAISGFVGHCERLEPEQVGAILSLYVGAMADSVDSFFGTVHVVMGDCVLASWNAARAQPDHALLAVSAAIDMVERTEDINRRLLAEDLTEIACAIGVNTGVALVRALGSRRGDHEIVGDTVNVARLLAEAAPPGGILIAEGTKVSLGGEILLEPTEIRNLPGKTKPVRVFRVLGRMTPLGEC